MKRTSTLILLIPMFMLVSCHSPQKLFYSELNEAQLSARTDSVQITEERIAHLPEAVQRYFHNCGFVGTPMTNHAEIIWQDTQIRLKPNQKWMRLKTFQHNFIDEPSRLVYMRANMLGFIPFEGRDKYDNGKGHMFGTLGRLIRVFDAYDEETAKGVAVVVLAEALLVPAHAIQPYIHWEAVDERTARARFIHNGMNVGGVFHFNDKGEYIRFTTNERPFPSPEGGYEQQDYTVDILNYQQQGAMKIARDVSAIWNLPEGDYEYWKGTLKEIRFY